MSFEECRVKPLAVTAFVATALAMAAVGQESTDLGERDTAAAAPPESIDTVTVRGQRIGKLLGELRLKIELAEEAVFARFNEINSTDDFDIHCRADTRFHSRMLERNCRSNSWQEQSGKIGTEVARSMQGRGNIGLAELHAQEQRRMQRLLEEEMQQLVAQDEQLQEAAANLTKAQFALVLVQGKKTLFRDVSAVGEETHGAERVFEVVMGVDAFRHRLTQHTFTIANVFGEVRKLEVECAEGNQRVDYVVGVDWTVPTDWTSCILRVAAKKGTTFRLYEF
jgi:hypothetical protein